MLTSNVRTEQLAVIKFRAVSGMTTTDTRKFMKRENGVFGCYRTIVFDWHKNFWKDQADIVDSVRSGRPDNDGCSIRDIQNVR